MSYNPTCRHNEHSQATREEAKGGIAGETRKGSSSVLGSVLHVLAAQTQQWK